MLTVSIIPALTDNYIYLIHDSDSEQTLAVDPAESEPVLTALKKQGWPLSAILNTHHHHDHVGGNLALKQATGCKIIGSANDQHRIPGIDQAFTDGDIIPFGRHTCRVIATPGHTLGHVVYYFVEENLLFSGDTLFSLGCGRLFEGTADQLWQSLQKIKALPKTTRIYCAHEYTQSNGRFALTLEPDNKQLQAKMEQVNSLLGNGRSTLPTTLADELACNPFLRDDSPAIQAAISMQNADSVQIFAEIRRLKDQF